MGQTLHDVFLEEGLDQGQNPAISNGCAHFVHEPSMRDAVESERIEFSDSLLGRARRLRSRD